MVKQLPKKASHAKIHWCFRDFLKSDELDDPEEAAERMVSFLLEHAAAYAFQIEAAPESGRLHYQGYVAWINRKRFEWIQKNWRHFEYLKPMLGSPLQAWTYATKQDTRVYGPWLFGAIPDAPGCRTDLKAFVKAIFEGMPDLTLWEEHPSSMVRYPNIPTRIRSIVKPIRTQAPLVIYMYGAPGTGKSRAAREIFPEIYAMPPHTNKMWITQTACLAKHVLIDDYSGELPLKFFNQVIDRYSIELETKGGFMWFAPDVIIITSNLLPCSLYKWEGRQDVQAQVYRRITNCYDFNTELGVSLMESLTCQQLADRYPQFQERPQIQPRFFGRTVPMFDPPNNLEGPGYQ